ncbi:hypothetical protein ACFL18_02350 [Patescibacteria group bacterium]
MSYLLAYTLDDGQLVEHQAIDPVMQKKMMTDWSAKKEYYPMQMKTSHTCTGGHGTLAIVTWLAFIALLVSMARYFWKKAE